MTLFRSQLVAAMNPCRCGGGNGEGATCRRGARCATDYQARISGPMLDRIDLQIQVPPVTPADLAFNQGWLVRAEAPPGILFSKFKHHIGCSNIVSADIAFYFVHWLTDLAGAEGRLA